MNVQTALAQIFERYQHIKAEDQSAIWETKQTTTPQPETEVS